MKNQSDRNQFIQAISDQGYDLQNSSNEFNEVFLAQSKKSNQYRVFVVFKQFNHYLTQAIEKIYSEQQEGKFKQIISVKDCFTSDIKEKQYYIVELTKADENLSEFYQIFSTMTQKRQKTLKLQIMTQVTLGLQELHRRNIVHRDIKPENILMIGKNAFIGDLGLIKLLSKDDPPSRINSENYSAPELYTNGKKYTFSVDIYSLGRLFLYILFGEPNINLAFQDQELWQIEIGRLICDMISQNPKKRPTLDKILNKLDQLDETQKIEEPLQMKKVKQN